MGPNTIGGLNIKTRGLNIKTRGLNIAYRGFNILNIKEK